MENKANYDKWCGADDVVEDAWKQRFVGSEGFGEALQGLIFIEV